MKKGIIAPFYFKAATADSLPVVTIDGFIGEGMSVNATDFMASFKEATAGSDQFELHINSGGGQVTEGMAIYDLIKASGKKVAVKVFGMAASMGAVLMLVGDTIEVAPNAMVMLHRVQAGGWNDADGLESLASTCRKYEDLIKGIVQKRTGKTAEEVNNWFKSGIECWFTATEATAAGLADRVVGEPTNSSAPAIGGKTQQEVYEQFYHQSPNKPSPMKPEHYKKLGLPENATDEQVADRAAEIATLKQRIAELEAEAAKVEADAVEALVAEAKAKIKPEALTAFKTLATADRASAKAMLDSLPLLNVTTTTTAKGTPPKSINEMIAAANGKGSPENEDRSNWTFEMYSMRDPNALRAMTEAQRDALPKGLAK
jgi:ATP-dependent Clp endopeptidase proteolytic subunit ClpP